MPGVSHDQDPEGPEQLRRLIEAMADPLRFRILSTVADATYEIGAKDDGRKGMTVRSLSERLEEPRRRVRYHLDALRADGLVEVSGSMKRRGTLERFFSAVHMPMLLESDIAHLPLKTQQKIFLSSLRMIFSDATASLATGAAVRHPDWVLFRCPAEVDEQARQELSALHVEFTKMAEGIAKRARERLEKTGEQPVKTVSASLFFETGCPDRRVLG